MPQTLTQHDTSMMLRAAHPKADGAPAYDAVVVKALTDLLNATLELIDEVPFSQRAVTVMAARKALAVGDLVAPTIKSETLDAGLFVSSQFLQTLSLSSVMKLSPGRATSSIALIFVEKVVAVAGFAGVNRCHVAIASLVVSVGGGGLACLAGGAATALASCIAAALAILADIFQVKQACGASTQSA